MTIPLAVQCRDVSKRYPHFQLENVNLSLERGAVMGLVGPNGAGKSTILRIVMGLITPDSGSVKVLGHSIPQEQIVAKREIGFVAEDMRLYENETISFHMEFIRSIFDSWDSEYAKKLLLRFDINEKQKVRSLSHGQRVKATLLLALARRPKLLVFDEPTTGLDPSARKEVLDEMMNALEDDTRSILFSSHNTLDVEKISDYITFIYGGRVIESHNKEDFMDSWRRLRLIKYNNVILPRIGNIKEVNQSGHLWTVTVNNYDDSLCEKFISSGLEIQAIEHLTLEEIFLSSVACTRSSACPGEAK